MVKLIDSDIRTREVLTWKGIHVFHFALSSCSQKLRIFLNLKNIKWESHHINLAAHENYTDWFLGINPRGLVPVLVHDGAVHIDSNDILLYLKEKFPDTRLIPAGSEHDIVNLLAHEDDLHHDLRTLSFRYVFAPQGPPKPAEALEKYIQGGSGTVRGQKDPDREKQLAFWERVAKEGITDDAVRTSAQRFRTALNRLDLQLDASPYLLGDTLSILDIAWFVYVNRLLLAGYPMERIHPRIYKWYARLMARPEFAKEVQLSDAIKQRFEATQEKNRRAGTSLETVAAL